MKDQRNYLLPGLYDWIVDSGMTPCVLVNLRNPSVILPMSSNAPKGNQCKLDLFSRHIQNMRFTNDFKIQFQAVVDGKLHDCSIPFDAVEWIYAKENTLGMMWPEKKSSSSGPISRSKSHTVVVKSKPQPGGIKLRVVKS